MKEVLADTGYWIALADRKDPFHETTLAISRRLRHHVVTSDMVLVEVLNFFSGRSEYLKREAVALVERILRNPAVTVVQQTHDLFLRAFELYRSRTDKGYSLTDCAMMVLASDRGIAEVLTTDTHFEQHGLTILLKIEA